jgi:uncharacterized protein YbcI
MARDAITRRDSSIHARISNGIGHLLAEYTGRGPTRARTTIDGTLVVCLLEDALSKGERMLVSLGKEDAVLQIRHTFQDAMEADAIALVSELTGRTVVAFMSTNHTDPDYAVEVFVLDLEIDRTQLAEGLTAVDG